MKIPKDYEDPACSSGVRRWVTAYFYGSSDTAVYRKMENYRKKWPTEGYSTYTVGGVTKFNTGYYSGILRRFSTCD